MIPIYEYHGRLLRIVDGDTIHAEIDLGCDVRICMTIRLYGINAPEVSTGEGRAAKAYVAQWFSENTSIDTSFFLRTIKDRKEKYGRYLGVVSGMAEETLNDALIREGYATKYFGGAR